MPDDRIAGETLTQIPRLLRKGDTPQVLGEVMADAIDGARERIAELEAALRAAIAIIRADDHPTRQGMANHLEEKLNAR